MTGAAPAGGGGEGGAWGLLWGCGLGRMLQQRQQLAGSQPGAAPQRGRGPRIGCRLEPGQSAQHAVRAVESLLLCQVYVEGLKP